ncbi:hypothetical protein FRB96_003931 [Tulasnella sp. 330]|nr:hypothetical protein FRB96_003931 [Tulasnella sp. 330]
MAMEYRLEMRIEQAMPQAVEHLLRAVIYKGDKIRKELVKHVLLWMPHVHMPDETPSEPVRQLVDALRSPTPVRPYQELLQVIAGSFMPTRISKGTFIDDRPYICLSEGCAIVADHCFWVIERHTNERTGSIKTATAEEVQRALRLAIQAYQSQRQKALLEAIVQDFPEPDTVSLSLSERLTVSHAWERGELNVGALDPSNARDKRVLELGTKLIDLVKEYRLPKEVQSTSQESSEVTN